MYYELIFLGLVTIGAPWLAKVADYRDSRKPFTLVGLSGIFFLLAAGFGLGLPVVETVTFVHMLGGYLLKLSVILGWILMALAGLSGIVEALRNLDDILIHKKA